ncbi:MAG: GFA family protein [Shimia sp.]
MTTRGFCFCRKITWEHEGASTWECYCHCDDCRRACSAPAVAWFGVPSKSFRWTGQALKTLQSSKGVYRHFCSDCGRP